MKGIRLTSVQKELARGMGAKAFHSGKKRVPIKDNELVMYSGEFNVFGILGALSKEWLIGWDKENLTA